MVRRGWPTFWSHPPQLTFLQTLDGQKGGALKQARIAILLLVLSACSVAAFAAPSSSPDAQADQQAIRQIENQWINATEMPQAERMQFFQRVLAPDGIHIVDSGQRYTHREILDYYRSHPQPPSKPRATFKDLNVRIYGATAIADGTTEISESKPGGQHEDRFTDVFEKRQGRWLAVNEQETRVAPTPPPQPH